MTLDELNDRFALLEAPRLATVYVSRHDCMTIQENDLKRRLANEVVLIGMKDEKPIYESAFKFWTGHARRHVYRRIAFTSKETPADTLNLFRGFGVTPREGYCERILAHIHEVICSGDDGRQRSHAEADGVADAEHRQAEPGDRHHADGEAIRRARACCSTRRC